MSYWKFLEDKVGKDVVYYCIQSFLLPSKKSVITKFKPTLKVLKGVEEELATLNPIGENIFETKKFGKEHLYEIKFMDEYLASEFLYKKLDHMGLKHILNYENLLKHWLKRRYIPFTYEYIGDLVLKGKVGIRTRALLDKDLNYKQNVVKTRRMIMMYFFRNGRKY